MTQEPITGNVVNEDNSGSYESYWGTDEVHRFWLPDGKQYFDIKPLDEGGKARFQKTTNKGIRMNQRSNEAHLDVDPAEERHQLIRSSVVSWNIMQPAPDGTFSQFPCPDGDAQRTRQIDVMLTKFNPKIIQDLEFFIRTKNPWMQADQKLEDLLEQREELEVLIKQAREREAGEASSASK